MYPRGQENRTDACGHVKRIKSTGSHRAQAALVVVEEIPSQPQLTMQIWELLTP